MDWTRTQKQAIYAQGKNLIVSAAAGSGKTAILTERIVRLILEGAGIDRFLVVTFTDAATSEMKRRISARLLTAAKENPDDAQRLRAQAMGVGRANISTLHAFCLYILRRNFHKLGLDPAFTPADAVLSEMLFREALSQAAEEGYKSAEESGARQSGFLLLLSAFNGQEEALFEQTRRLHDFLFAQPDPWGWLNAAVGAYAKGDEIFQNPAMEDLLSVSRASALLEIDKLLFARALIPLEDAFMKTRALLDEDMAAIRALGRSRTIESYRERLLAITFARFTWPQKRDPGCKEQVAQLRDEVKKGIKTQQLLFAHSLEDEAARMRAFHPVAEALKEFVKAVDARYQEEKLSRGKVDFTDMEHLALKALEDEEVRAQLRSRFQYVFVDEYQDSSRIQECLLERVSRGDNLFLVGDVKQSIYRFRQAEPALFLDKLARYTGGEGEQVHLNTNFRSEQPILDAVNDLFSRVMTAEAGEIDYDERQRLSRIDSAPPAPLAGVEFHLLDAGGAQDAADEEEDSDDLRPEAAEAEAIFAARRIRALMREAKGAPRPLRYQDFAVLLRSHRSTGEVFAAALAREGIPAYVQLTGGYFDAIEVQVFLNLLRVIDNRRQDIPLASVLRSPVFDFDEELLVILTTDYPADTLFDRLTLAARGEDALSSRARAALESLDKWFREARLLPLDDFICWLLDESLFYECMGALPAGKERQANLDALAIRAREFIQAGSAADLHSFLIYMDGAKSSAMMGSAQAGAADVVRVLSMHRSKGLEFPVVILAGLAKAFNRRDERAPVLFDSALGLGLRLTLEGVRRDTFLRRAIAARIRRKNLAEEMRVLYVAMTRARLRLILIASKAGAREHAAKAREKALTPAACLNAGSYLDWLLGASFEARSIPLQIHTDIEPEEGAKPLKPPEEEDVLALQAALGARFSFTYPYADAVAIPTKLSVSELTARDELVFRDPPSFTLPEKTLTAAQRGTAIHACLNGMRLRFEGDALAHVSQERDRLHALGLLTDKQAAAIVPRDIAWFLQSGLYARLLRCERVERELAFSAELAARLVIETQSDEPLLLQGVIDCCFVENDAWVLIDYKTDHVQTTPQEDAKKHAPQLALYALALSRMTGIPVKERVVVMLNAHAIVTLE